MCENGIIADRSQSGNMSFFRNETLNSIKFVWDPGNIVDQIFIYLEWVLPDQGILELDFVYLIDPPIEQSLISKMNF